MSPLARASSKALCLLAVLAFATEAAAADLSGEWSVQGRHSRRGAYTGKVTIRETSDGACTLSASCVVGSNGERFTMTGAGTHRGNNVSVRFTLTSPGLVGAIGGAPVSEECRGSYVVAADGKKLTGYWRAASRQHSANETLTRAPSAEQDGRILALLDATGREVREECLSIDPSGLASPSHLLTLRVKKTSDLASSTTIRIDYPEARLALWKSAAKREKVASGATIPNENATLFVEGLAPSDAGAGKSITAKLVQAGTALGGGSAVVAHVARNAFHLAGHGANGASTVQSWLEGARRDRRASPTFVEGKDETTSKRVFWAVWVIQDEAGAKVAIATENAVISYDGHSNFGMGFAFQTGFRRIDQFFNIADPQVPVNWPYLREHQEHPDLMIADAEYADDAATREVSDPVQVPKLVRGKLGSYSTSRYPASGGAGTRLHLTRGTPKWRDYHYTIDDAADNARIVIKAGSADMPAKRWSKLYLHSCYSGQYYSDSFGGRGALFFTHDEAVSFSDALPEFLKACVQGKTNDQILRAINAAENLNDYMVFGG